MAANPRTGVQRLINERRTSNKDRRHQHLLDTGVRSSEAGKQRRKQVAKAVTVSFAIVAAIAGIYVGGVKIWARVVAKNPQYNISELSVETDGILSPEDVLETAGLHKGANIFRVDLAGAQARVAAIPEVEQVLISRQLPNRVSIQISERKPVAWIAPARGMSREEVVDSKQSWLVDVGGILLHPKKLNPQDRYLPLIRNYAGGSMVEGQEAAGEEIKAALDLLHTQQEASNNGRFQIREIDLAKHFGLVVTDRNGLQVLFGLDEMDRQLKRLDVYLQALDQNSQKPQTINLLVERNVPVTFMVDAVTTDKPMPTAVAAAPTPAPVGVMATKDKSKTKEKESSKPKAREKIKPPVATRPKTGVHKEQPFLEHSPDVRKALPVNSGH